MLIEILMKVVPTGPIDCKPALVQIIQIMANSWTSDKP